MANVLAEHYARLDQLQEWEELLQIVRARIDALQRDLDGDALIPSVGVRHDYQGHGGGLISDPTATAAAEWARNRRTIISTELRELLEEENGLAGDVTRLRMATVSISRAIARLEPTVRRIVEARYLERRTNTAIAVEIGVDETTVRYHLAQASRTILSGVRLGA